MTIGFNNLNSLLSQYGVSQSGNIQTDLAALKKAMQAKGENTSAVDSFAGTVTQMQKTKGANHKKTDQTQKSQSADQSQQAQGQQDGPPWASLMQTLGLEPQGSPDADFAAMTDKLQQMSASATTPDQKANIQSLASQVEQYESMASSMQQQGSQGASSSSSSLPSLSSIMQNFMAQNTSNSSLSDNGSGSSSASQQYQQGSLPWESLMQSVGVSPQGSADADFAAISSKLSQMSSFSVSPAQQANIYSLQSQLEQYQLQMQQFQKA